MNVDEAKRLLSFHSCRNEDVENEKFENGFLGSLRPFRGQLDRRNFDEVIECLRVLKDEIAAPDIDKGIVSDVTSILHLGKCWAEDVLSKEQTIYLTKWIEIIEESWFWLLEGVNDEKIIFRSYREYLNGMAVHIEVTHLDGRKKLI